METVNNQQKYENYREQFKRLNLAIRNGFNLEAMFIEYAILEDRTESIIRHGGKWEAYIKSRKGHGANIDSKVKYIRKQAECKSNLEHKYFSAELLDEILEWKEERNRMIHALLNQNFEHNEISSVAEKGKDLVSLIRTKAGSFNRAADKQNIK